MAIDFKRIKEDVPLRDYADDVLQHAHGGLVCPVCGSGTGPNGTPAFSIMPSGKQWKCFACPDGRAGDVLDLAGIVNQTGDRVEQARAALRWAGLDPARYGIGEAAPSPTGYGWNDTITATSERQSGRSGSAGSPENDGGGTSAHKSPKKAVETVTDAMRDNRRREAERVLTWRANIDHPEAVAYLESRGWTLEEARAQGMGYDSYRKRLVITWPGCDWYHIDRDVTGEHPHKYLVPGEDKVGKRPLYNVGAVSSGCGSLFVVEGPMDAIAVKRCGFEAVALSGTSDGNGFLKDALLSVPEEKCPNVIVMLDRDKAGRDAAPVVVETLREAGVERVERVELDAPGLVGKDADEMARNDMAALAAALQTAALEFSGKLRAEEEERYRKAMEAMHVMEPASVMERIWSGEGVTAPVPTGIRGLDSALDGGLRPGVVVLGAISSLGKTTLVLQIADYIAAHGHPVLFVTVEQGADELVSKSLSRIMRGYGYEVPDRDIRGIARTAWPQEEETAFYHACEDYGADTDGKLLFLEGINQPSVKDVRAVAERMTKKHGRPPVVFIDYLQLLKPANERDTDKQATDKNVTALRQMAREMKATVFVISSLNRASYKGIIDLDSFKESGAIEYGADVLMGLQPYNIAERRRAEREKGQKLEDVAASIIKRTKERHKRELELVILKNRAGKTKEDGVPVTMVAASNIVYDGLASAVPPLRRDGATESA